METLPTVKGILLDYGGTIDTNGLHWMEVLRKAYAEEEGVVWEKELREAYVYAERYLATHPVVEPTDDFRRLLLKKIRLQLGYLKERGSLSSLNVDEAACRMADFCNNYVLQTLEQTRSTVRWLSERYPLCLVSNFYGNIAVVLKRYRLDSFFQAVVESSVVGVRKPDPALFRMGVEALGLQPEETLVVGDSYEKDICPAHQLGCFTAWLKGKGWDETPDVAEEADVILTDLNKLPFFLSKRVLI